MLSVSLNSGEYITIGDNIVVQVFRTGDSFRVAVEAPREMQIVRSEVLERTGECPECIQKAWRKPRSDKGFKRPAQAVWNK